MKLGVIADIHGNEVALRAVLRDAARCHLDRWWVLGDLGTLEHLAALPAQRRRHPNAAFMAAVLTGQREQLRTPSAAAR